MAFVIAGDV